jgi:hypothetical protein
MKGVGVADQLIAVSEIILSVVQKLYDAFFGQIGERRNACSPIRVSMQKIKRYRRAAGEKAAQGWLREGKDECILRVGPLVKRTLKRKQVASENDRLDSHLLSNTEKLVVKRLYAVQVGSKDNFRSQTASSSAYALYTIHVENPSDRIQPGADISKVQLPDVEDLRLN